MNLVGCLLESIYLAVPYQRLVEDLAGFYQLQKRRATDTVHRSPQVPDGLAERLRLRSVRLQTIHPLMDTLMQNRHLSAQIVRIFHLGSPSGFGRKALHPKYIRARNRGPTFSPGCVEQTLHPK